MVTQLLHGCYWHLSMTRTAKEKRDVQARSFLTSDVYSHTDSCSQALHLACSALTLPQIHTPAVKGGFLTHSFVKTMDPPFHTKWSRGAPTSLSKRERQQMLPGISVFDT